MTSEQDAALDDTALLTELRRLLKPQRGSEPKVELIAVAVRLAREPQLDPSIGGFWKAANVTASGATRKRILGYRDRIMGEGLLAAAQEAIKPATQPACMPCFGLEAQLLVQDSWMDEHVPLLRSIVVEPLVLSPGRRHATRALSAHHEQSTGESLHGIIEYDLPPAAGETAAQGKLRRDRHRRREEAVLRALDGDAAEEHRARRAVQKADEREHEDAIAATLERLISKIERTARRDALRWRCPGGCARGDPACARLAFRYRCIPPTIHGDPWPCDPLLYRDEEVRAELRDDFLALWDGVVEPIFFLEPELSARHSEFLGYEWFQRSRHAHCYNNMIRRPAELISRNEPDPFSDIIFPVGQAACLRRGCLGCCYCRKLPPLPARLQVREFLPEGCNLVCQGGYQPLLQATVDDGVAKFLDWRDMTPEEWRSRVDKPEVPHKLTDWTTVDELRDWIVRRANGAVCTLPRADKSMAMLHACVPHYLLERPGHGARMIGGVLCVPGAVRALVSAEELDAWTEALADGGVNLQILSSTSPEYLPTALEEEMRDSLLWLKRDSMDEGEAWLKEQIAAERAAAELKREAAKARRAAFLEQRQLRCFLFCERCRVSRKSRNLAVGDMVCPTATDWTTPGASIAVVAQLGFLEDLHGPPIPTGVCDLLEWDSDRAEFWKSRRDVPLSHLELFPICCGQARCANLHKTHTHSPHACVAFGV
jgi:hypothetical protein